MREAIQAYDWPTGEACQVAYCESRFHTDAYAADNWGLFQVWGEWAVVFGLDSRRDLWTPEINIRVAYAIWHDYGWQPWACKPWRMN